MPPIVNGSASPVDALSGMGVCGNNINPAGSHWALRLRSAPAFARDFSLCQAELRRPILSPTRLQFCNSSRTIGTWAGSVDRHSTPSLDRSGNLFEFDNQGNAGKLFLDPASGAPLD